MANVNQRERISRLLIVEDDESQRQMLKAIMEDEGFDVVACGAASEALEKIRENEFGVALVDQRLGEITGIDLLKALQEVQSEIRVIIHTAFGTYDSARDAVNLGAYAYVEKVGDPIILVKHVRRAFRSHFEEYFDRMEEAVAERTRQLSEANEELLKEIEARERAEEGLNESRRQLQLVIGEMPVIVWALDPEGTITFCEGRGGEDFGANRSFYVGASAFDGGLIDHNFVTQIINSAGGSVHASESVDGDCVWNHRAIGYNDPTGKMGSIFGISIDITEQRQAEEHHRRLETQMRHAQKLESLGVLAGGIAHDLNNLLVGVLGSASMALDLVSEESVAVTCLEQIEKAGHRATDLCRQLLSYSGKGRFDMQPIDLTDLVREITELVKITVSKNVDLDWRLNENLSAIAGDSSQIQQVVMNLFINAAEAIGDQNGTITLETGELNAEQLDAESELVGNPNSGERFVFLRVTDTGCGMDDATVERIFEPFFTTKFTGRGLGMSAVFGIVRGHSAEISCKSQLGIGTKFEVVFPATKEKVAKPKPASDADHLKEEHRATVLVVDDEEIVRDVTVLALEQYGFSVLTANDGVEGFEMFVKNQDHLDAVVLDQTMPRMKGEEVFAHIREIDRDVFVVISSGYSEDHVIADYSGKSPPVFMQKPFRVQDLAAVIKDGLRQSSKA